MKIRLFFPFCLIPAIFVFLLHQENGVIHFLYQVQSLRFIHLSIYSFSRFFNKELTISLTYFLELLYVFLSMVQYTEAAIQRCS